MLRLPASLDVRILSPLLARPVSDHRHYDHTLSQDGLKLQAWVNLAELSAANTMDKIAERNFTFPANGQGIPFTTGRVQLGYDDEAVAYGTHYLILADITVGRSFVVNKKRLEEHGTPPLPPGYDSM